MKKKVKWITAVILIVFAAGAGAVAALAPISAETVTLAPRTASITFTESAVYAYDNSYTVYPIVSGEVLEVRVKVGDIVRAGDVLAVVDAVDYREQIEQLTASIVGYNGQIANLGLQDQQLAQAREALGWAARTYLVAALSAIATLLYYLSFARRN